MEKNNKIRELLKCSGISPTPNRVLVLRAIAEAENPIGLIELEALIGTLDKSSIFRVLNLLETHELIHAIQDGRGIAKYELTHIQIDSSKGEDMHIHFYCEHCRRTFCLQDIGIPKVAVPPGFSITSVNYMLKGNCPDCNKSL